MNNYNVTIDEECALTRIVLTTKAGSIALRITLIAERLNKELTLHGPKRFVVVTEDIQDVFEVPVDEGSPLFITVGTDASMQRVVVDIYNTDDLPANAFIRLLDALTTM